MRTLTTLTLIGLASVLSACATNGTNSRYGAELERLAADCEARGGILEATGQHTGQVAADNVCKISGAGSRIPG